MNFSGKVNTISELTEQTSVDDNDYLSTGTTDLKRIKFSNLCTLLKEKLGINELNRNINTDGGYTYLQQSGQNYIRYLIKNKRCYVQAYTSNATLTATNYVDLFNLPKPKASFFYPAIDVSMTVNIMLHITDTGLIRGMATKAGTYQIMAVFDYDII